MKIAVFVIGISLIIIGSIFLYTRTASSAPLSPDGEVIFQLKKAGSNITKTHEIEFFFYFPTIDAAKRIALKLETQGLKITKIDHAADGNDFVVIATKSMIPSESELSNMGKIFDDMSATEHGVYDGWGAPVVK